MQTALPALAAAVLVFTAQHPAHGLSCGSVITEDTVLDQDLTDCPGDGIIIGANGVTLRLHGHTIDGNGSGLGIFPFQVLDITIKGPGTIRDFGVGIWVGDVDRIQISDVTLATNGIGISSGAGLRGLTVLRSKLIENEIGLTVRGPEVKIKDNEFIDNRIGITGGRGTNSPCEFIGNKLTGNVESGMVFSSLGGFVDCVIERNEISGSQEAIRIDPFSGPHTIRHNRLDRNGSGIIFGGTEGVGAGSGSQVVGNRIANHDVGIEIVDPGSGAILLSKNRMTNVADPISDNGTGTILDKNRCDPPDDDPVCSGTGAPVVAAAPEIAPLEVAPLATAPLTAWPLTAVSLRYTPLKMAPLEAP
jgi:hypothetical protein